MRRSLSFLLPPPFPTSRTLNLPLLLRDGDLEGGLHLNHHHLPEQIATDATVSLPFLGATKHLYNWLCPSVGWSVGL